MQKTPQPNAHPEHHGSTWQRRVSFKKKSGKERWV
jgi:hypothetical protein